MMNRKMMRQAQQLQNKLAKAQQELEEMSVEGSAGGGVVRVTMTGKQEVTEVVIEPEAAEDIDLLQDLVAAAVNDAFSRTQEPRRPEDGSGNRRHEHPRPVLDPPCHPGDNGQSGMVGEGNECPPGEQCELPETITAGGVTRWLTRHLRENPHPGVTAGRIQHVLENWIVRGICTDSNGSVTVTYWGFVPGRKPVLRVPVSAG